RSRPRSGRAARPERASAAVAWPATPEQRSPRSTQAASTASGRRPSWPPRTAGRDRNGASPECGPVERRPEVLLVVVLVGRLGLQAGREIVEIDVDRIVLVIVDAVDAPVGLQPDGALRTARLLAAVRALALVARRRVGTEVALARRRRRGRRVGGLVAGFTRAARTTERTRRAAGRVRACSAAAGAAERPRPGTCRSRFARLRLLHRQRAATEELVVEPEDCFLRVRIVSELDERETA